MAEASELIVERTGEVLVLTLNRPAKRNALSEGLVEELTRECERAGDTPTRLVVLRGLGRSFSAGFDFGDLDQQSDGDLLRRFVRIENLLQTLYQAPYESLALAHGRVFGAGADLLCACSHRVAAPGTSFRLPGLAFGIVLGTRRLATRIGADGARLVQLGGAVLGAERAAMLGLLTEVTAQDRWPQVQRAVEESVAAVPASALPTFRRACDTDSADADLADLVRSAAAAGLRERIQRFRSEPRP